MRELERLTQAMQRHWLLRRYVNKTNPPPLRLLTTPPEPGAKASERVSLLKRFNKMSMRLCEERQKILRQTVREKKVQE